MSSKEVAPRPMTQAEIDACEGILAGESPRVAYRRATGNASRHAFDKFMADAEVGAYLAARRMELQERLGVSDMQWLEEVSNAAFFDPAEIVAESITCPQDIAKLPLHVRKLITGWKWTEFGFQLELVNKQRAQDMWAKSQGIYQKDRQNERDSANRLQSLFWRFVFALHVHEGISIEEAKQRAHREKEAMEEWGREQGILPPADADGEIVQ